jgi:hypothetical protein
MAAYYRKKRKRRGERYTPAEKRRYWDEKTLAEPNKLPLNYAYHVPEVPPLKEGPTLTEVGLTTDIKEIVAYYHDKSAKKPDCLLPKIGDHLGGLIFTAGATGIGLALIIALDSSSRRSSPLVGLLGIAIGGVGGFATLRWLWLLITTPINATIAKVNFGKLSPTSGPSLLLGGKSLQEVERILKERELAIEAKKLEHKAMCEARTAEIWRRHRLRIERLTAKRELERLQHESQSKAEQYEVENFPVLAINPSYWSSGSSTEKGVDLERKFGKLLRDAGYSVQFTPTSGDDGVDILASKDGQKIAVQCKNYIAKVGAGEIRDFAGALKFVRENSPKTIGWLVAPNGFSEATFHKYHRPDDLELWDFSDIQEMVIETYNQQVDEADEELGAV